MLNISRILYKIVAYEGIYDCPIKKYVDCVANDDLIYLAKHKIIVRLFKIDLSIVFDRINDQLIDEFNISNTREVIFFKTKSMLNMICDYYIDNKKSLITKIKILQNQIDKLENSNKNDADIKKVYATNFRIIHKWSGRNPKELTIFEYFNDLDDYKKELADAHKNNI